MQYAATNVEKNPIRLKWKLEDKRIFSMQLKRSLKRCIDHVTVIKRAPLDSGAGDSHNLPVTKHKSTVVVMFIRNLYVRPLISLNSSNLPRTRYPRLPRSRGPEVVGAREMKRPRVASARRFSSLAVPS